MDVPAPSGPVDALTDVTGLRVGHAQRSGDGWLTGTTVVLAPEGGAVAAVDVRGGGPGTRETDALGPTNLVQRVEAIVLTGGSAFGLDAASGVAAWLAERGRGFRVGPQPWQVVPVVPAAALFDLGRGGDWRARPDATFGRDAVEAAASTAPGSPVAQGSLGAGTGAVAGGLKGGVGSASAVLASGVTVAALAAVNAAGSVLDPATGVLYGQAVPTLARWSEPASAGAGGAPGAGTASDAVPHRPTPAEHAAARRRLAEARSESERRSAAWGAPPLNTTLAVVATDAALTRAQAQRLAGTAHDGLARAVLPVHLMSDGDTVFTLATGDLPLVPEDTEAAGDPAFGVHREAGALDEVLSTGSDVLTRAVVKAVLAATGVDGPGGVFPAYRDLYRLPAVGPSEGG